MRDRLHYQIVVGVEVMRLLNESGWIATPEIDAYYDAFYLGMLDTYYR